MTNCIDSDNLKILRWSSLKNTQTELFYYGKNSLHVDEALFWVNKSQTGSQKLVLLFALQDIVEPISSKANPLVKVVSY